VQLLRSLEDFATKYNLVLAQDKNLERLGKRLSNLRVPGDPAMWSRYILGRNGSVIESSRPGRLLVSIVYLSGWERAKLEFRLAYHHIRVLPDKCSDGALWGEFSADDERQASLVIELAQLTPLYDDKTLSQKRSPNLIVASVLRRCARALRELGR
jgi:hypothetical protein